MNVGTSILSTKVSGAKESPRPFSVGKKGRASIILESGTFWPRSSMFSLQVSSPSFTRFCVHSSSSGCAFLSRSSTQLRAKPLFWMPPGQSRARNPSS